MSRRLTKCLPQLEFISKIKKDPLRQKVLNDQCDYKLYCALHEIASNFKNKNIKLNEDDSAKIKKYLTIIESLASKSVKKTRGSQGSRQRKKIINQTGGLLPLLIPAVISILGEIIARNVA